MAYSQYTNYRLENIQRETLRYSLLSVWWYRFAHDAHGAPGTLFDLTYNWPNLPPWVEPLSLYLFLGLQCWLFYRVFLVNARRGMMPHPNLIVPYLALMVWSLPQLQLNNLCFAIIPFFHSLQYLAFVYRIENSQEIRDTYHFNRQLYSSIISMALITCGWLSFLAVPGGLDAAVSNKAVLGIPFFIICFHLFINIHHYFLDNTLWKMRDDPTVARALFGPRES